MHKFPCENFSEISARSLECVFGRRDFHLAIDLGPRSRHESRLGAFLAAEKISRREYARSRRDEISAAKNAPRLLAISARSRRPKTRRDYWRDLGEMKISAAKNAPRLQATSRREKNLDGQKRAEISSEIAPR